MRYIKINENLYEFNLDGAVFKILFKQFNDTNQISFSSTNPEKTKKYIQIFSILEEIIFNDYIKNHNNINKYLMFITPDSSENNINRRISIYKKWLTKHDSDWEISESKKDLSGNLKGSSILLLTKRKG